jgi:hypothetical protein
MRNVFETVKEIIEGIKAIGKNFYEEIRGRFFGGKST